MLQQCIDTYKTIFRTAEKSRLLCNHYQETRTLKLLLESTPSIPVFFQHHERCRTVGRGLMLSMRAPSDVLCFGPWQLSSFPCPNIRQTMRSGGWGTHSTEHIEKQKLQIHKANTGYHWETKKEVSFLSPFRGAFNKIELQFLHRLHTSTELHINLVGKKPHYPFHKADMTHQYITN